MDLSSLISLSQQPNKYGPPPPCGSMHHLTLSVHNMEKSILFYRLLCVDILGFAEHHSMSEHSLWWKYGAGGINASHNKFIPGLHHLALNMDSREQINRAYRRLRAFYIAHEGKEMGRILDEPAEYRYMKGYYAVYFTDPDGMKLELVHTPSSSFP